MKSEISRELERYFARHLSELPTEAWRALDAKERQSFIQKARRLLKLERRFLERKTDAADEAEEAE